MFDALCEIKLTLKVNLPKIVCNCCKILSVEKKKTFISNNAEKARTLQMLKNWNEVALLST